MSLTNDGTRFGSINKLLHWGIFLAFVFQFSSAYYRECLENDDPLKVSLIIAHKQLGFLLLFIGLFFLFWRHLGKRPAHPANTPGWQKILSVLVHVGLMLSVFAMSISGYLMSTYAGYPIQFFGHSVPMIVGKDKAMGALLHDIHTTLPFIVSGLILVHILAAIWHHRVCKNNVLKRMLPFGG